MKLNYYQNVAPTFGARLRYILLVENISNKRLARNAGISLSIVSIYLSGHREPSFKNLTRILEALPASYAYWLVTGKEAA